MKVCDIIPETAILDDLQGADAEQAINEMVSRLSADGQIPKTLMAKLTKALLAREAVGTTGLGRGVAVPHAKVGGLKGQIGAFGRSRKGIDFRALDGAPVFGVFMVLTPEECPDLNLKALGAISVLCRHERFINYLRDAKDVAEIASLIADAEQITAAAR